MVMWFAAVGPICETNICRVFFKPEVVAYTEIRYFFHLVGVAEVDESASSNDVQRGGRCRVSWLSVEQTVYLTFK